MRSGGRLRLGHHITILLTLVTLTLAQSRTGLLQMFFNNGKTNPENAVLGCAKYTLLDDPIGTFTEGPGTYASRQECHWLIRSDDARDRITIEFTQFQARDMAPSTQTNYIISIQN